jgi:FkbM family methyltransferase
VEGKETFTTPKGSKVQMFFRDDTSDRSVIESVLTNDEYNLRQSDYEGWGVDIGAHVGAWSIAAAVDNPNLLVVAIEAVYENVLMMQRNVKLNDLEKRVKPLYRAASSSNHSVNINYGYKGNDFAAYNRYIGNLSRPTNEIDGGDHEVQAVQGLRLTRLRRMLGEDIRIMKIDCEGCEWHFLKSAAIGSVHELVGEWHDRSQAELLSLLSPTHSVSILTGSGGLGTFRAIRSRSFEQKSSTFELESPVLSEL